jgi:hypothetical protein
MQIRSHYTDAFDFFGVKAISFISTSDRRLKTNIRPSDVQQLRKENIELKLQVQNLNQRLEALERLIEAKSK